MVVIMVVTALMDMVEVDILLVTMLIALRLSATLITIPLQVMALRIIPITDQGVAARAKQGILHEEALQSLTTWVLVLIIILSLQELVGMV